MFARRPEDTKRLLVDEPVDLVWTDPPYGVAYVGKTSDALQIENDRVDDEELERVLSDPPISADAEVRRCPGFVPQLDR